jgi:putative endonuclease
MIGKPTSKRLTGDRFEQQACDVLVRGGMLVIARNYSTRFGEIDLIMRDRDVVVFVEVRYRRSGGFGGAAASVTEAKRARLVRAAQCFLLTHAEHARRPCRFDVVSFDGPSTEARMQWCRAAFDAS